MPRFSLTLIDAAGLTTRSMIVAENANQAEARGEKEGLTVVQIEEVSGGRNAGSSAELSPAKVQIFCERMASMLNNRLIETDSLSNLAKKSPDKVIRAVSLEVLERTQSQGSLSKAIKATGRFPALVEGALDAGTDVAGYPQTFTQLNELFTMLVLMQQKLQMAMISPVVGVLSIIGLFLVLLFYVVPILTPVISSLGVKAGGFLSILQIVSAIAHVAWPFALLAAIGLTYLLTTRNRYRARMLHWGCDTFKIIGELIYGFHHTIIYKILEMLLNSKMPPAKYFTYLQSVCRNSALEHQMNEAAETFKTTSLIYPSLAKITSIDSEVIYRIQLAETAGSLSEEIGAISKWQESITRLHFDSFSLKITPALDLLLGLAVGALSVLVIAVFVSLYNTILRAG